MIDLNWLQYPASILAVLGAYLSMSMSRKLRRLAFTLFTMGNILLIAWSSTKGDSWGVFGMYLLFLISSIGGMWTHRKESNATNSLR